MSVSEYDLLWAEKDARDILDNPKGYASRHSQIYRIFMIKVLTVAILENSINTLRIIAHYLDIKKPIGSDPDAKAILMEDAKRSPRLCRALCTFFFSIGDEDAQAFANELTLVHAT